MNLLTDNEMLSGKIFRLSNKLRRYLKLFSPKKDHIFTLTLLFFQGPYSFAQWPPLAIPNKGVSTTNGNEHNFWGNKDGTGGAYFTWEDNRGSSNDIYAQRYDGAGYEQWPVNGVSICVTDGHQHDPYSSEDGFNNSIIAWEDDRGSSKDIYAQKVDLNGTVQWTSNGIVVCSATSNQYGVKIIADGLGGSIFVWEDDRGSNTDIYAQKVNSSGVIQWTANGILICSGANSQNEPQLISDGAGGAIITWQDKRSGTEDIYAQRIDASGNVQWTANGVVICNAAGYQGLPQIASDGNDGAIITYEDKRSGQEDIYAQRINGSGIVQWTANGILICNATSTQLTPQICANNYGGVVIAWDDKRSGNNDIYAQRVDASGNVQWTANGVVVCNAANTQMLPSIASGEFGHTLIAWQDKRTGTDDIYLQMLDYNGAVYSPSNGTAVTTAASSQQNPLMLSNGGGNWVVGWLDGRNSSQDLYAQGLNKDTWSPLPVEFLSFEAKLMNERVTLFWATATERNNDYFTVERSFDSYHFEEITRVNGAGNSTVNRYYTADDLTALKKTTSGKLFYRIKQTDYDGTSNFSTIISLQIDQRSGVTTIFPNPVKDEIYIKSRINCSDQIKLTIHEVSGKEVFSKWYPCTLNNLDFLRIERKFPKGVYILSLISEKDSFIERIVIE